MALGIFACCPRGLFDQAAFQVSDGLDSCVVDLSRIADKHILVQDYLNVLEAEWTLMLVVFKTVKD